MGKLTFFLGLQVKHKKDGTFNSQDKYVAKIFKKFRFTEVNTASTPMETQKPFLKDEYGKEVDVHMYRSMIGSLMYLTSLRPDIMFAVCVCAGYQVNLKVSHLHTKKGFLDEAVHKELGDRLVRATTIASSLEAEQDSDGGPRCQETMRDTTAQTRFKSVSKNSNDSLLAKGNTLQSDEDSMKLNELMALWNAFQNRVLDLEKTTTTQPNEIDSLKRRVKKLEKRNRSRTHKLKRLYKVGLSARVESSGDEESLGEDASKQRRMIDAFDADEDITLVNDADKEMFDVDDLGGEEVFVAGQNENVIEEVVNDAQVSTTATTVTITTEVITLAQALEALKTSKPKVKGIVFQEPYEEKVSIDAIPLAVKSLRIVDWKCQ
nr:hypothetical protein [Tanacetum cinerariifolium]